MIFRSNNKYKRPISLSTSLFSFIMLFSFTGISYLLAQSETANKRFVTQEDRELEKIKINRVRTRTAVTYQKGSFSKVSPEGVITEYIKFDKNGNRLEQTQFRLGQFVDTKWVFENDANGNVSKLNGIDNLGKTVYERTSRYDENNNEIERIEVKANMSDDYISAFMYNSQNMLTQVDTYKSNGDLIWSEKYTYEGNKLIQQESVNEKGETVTVKKFKHNEAGLIIEEIDASPNLDEPVSLETYKYDNSGRVTEHETGSFRQLFYYDKNGDVELDILYNMLKTRQHKFGFKYGDNGLLIERTRYGPTDKVVYVVEYEYEYY
ncbi:hypothetical protein ACFLR4_02685 [Bacteroidota bacterium]